MVGGDLTAFDSPSSDSVQGAATIRRDERRTAGVAWSAHALHDGYTDLIYVLLPIWRHRGRPGCSACRCLHRACYAAALARFAQSVK